MGDFEDAKSAVVQFITTDHRATMPVILYPAHRNDPILVEFRDNSADRFPLHSIVVPLGRNVVTMWPPGATHWTADGIDYGKPQWWRPA